MIKEDYSAQRIDKSIVELLQNSDLNIVNLESPVTITEKKILKTGPHLRAAEQPTLEFLKHLNIGLVTLANNHIYDYGHEGLQDTISFCKKNGIRFTGAGNNIEEALRPCQTRVNGHRITVLNFAENEWANADRYKSGANPLNIIENARQIKKEKEQADFLFVIIHGGHEYYNLPSLRMQDQYRFYADCGADLVVGHHTHCLNGFETYNGTPIFYSLGNFLFTKSSKHEGWYNGMILEVLIDDEGNLSTSYALSKQEKETYALSLVSDDEYDRLKKDIEGYNSIISDRNKLVKEWDAYVNSKYHSYLTHWSFLSFMPNKIVWKIFSILGIKGFNKKTFALYLNLMRCEAHADMSKEVLTKYLEK